MRQQVNSGVDCWPENDPDYRPVLKLYGISSLQPQQWEAVDHDKDGPLAGALTGEDGSIVEGVDPLGLRGRLTGYVLSFLGLDHDLTHPERRTWTSRHVSGDMGEAIREAHEGHRCRYVAVVESLRP